MYIYEDHWHLKASQLEPWARNSPLINVFIQQHVQALVCPLFSNCPFWRCCYALNSWDAHCFYICCKENNGAYFHFARTERNMWFKICTNRDLNLVPEINMCKGGERNSFLVGIRNGAWSLWNSNATGSYNYLFNSHGKAALLFQQYFLLKNFCEIVSNLLEDLLHQGRACAVKAKRQADWKQSVVYTQGGLLRCAI